MEHFNIIIIDDEPNFLQSLANTVNWNELGLKLCGIFTDANKALEYIEANDINIVITDIKMPKMSGKIFAEICKKNFPEIKIIFMSAYSDFDVARFAISNNVSGYLLKPVSYNELIETLVKVVNTLKTEKKNNQKKVDPLFTYQQIFFKIFYGLITNKAQLQMQLGSSGLAPDTANYNYSILKIELCDFQSYLDNSWKHESYRFYDAVNSILKFSSNTVSFYLIRYYFNFIDCVVICQPNDNFEIFLQKTVSELESELFSNLKIKCKIKIFGIYNNVYEMLGQDLELISNDIPINENTIDISLSYMKEHCTEDITLNDVAANVFLSPAYFSVLFKRKTNESFTATINSFRIEKAKLLLSTEDIKPSFVYLKVGFKSYTYFFKRFKEICGITPAEYKKIHYKN